MLVCCVCVVAVDGGREVSETSGMAERREGRVPVGIAGMLR